MTRFLIGFALILGGGFFFFYFKKAEVIPKVYFTNIKEGDTIQQKVLIKFSVDGLSVRPAGEDPSDKKSGHHHILIDNLKGYIPLNQVIPMDDKHLHFGKGQKEATLTLKPGKHKLTLQFADGAHRSYGKNLAQSIHINVK